MTVNNENGDIQMNLPAGNAAEYIGALSGQKVSVNGGCINVNVKANSGEIWIPYTGKETFEPVMKSIEPVEKQEISQPEAVAEPVRAEEPEEVTTVETVEASEPQKAETASEQEETAEQITVDWSKPYEEMSIPELQEGILEKMRKNGPVTERMKLKI